MNDWISKVIQLKMRSKGEKLTFGRPSLACADDTECRGKALEYFARGHTLHQPSKSNLA
jgi:hypothetical protein